MTAIKLTSKDQETAKQWADMLIADIKDHANEIAPRQYPNPGDWLDGGGDLMDMPTVAGKPIYALVLEGGRIMD